MNKIFKVVWSKSKECYVVVSEVAKNNGGKKKVLASVLAGLAMVGATAQMGTPVQAGSNTNGNNINVWSNQRVDTPTPGGPAVTNTNTQNTAGDNSVTIGQQLTTGTGAVAVGRLSTAAGDRAVAIGENVNAKKEDTISVGSSNNSNTGGGITIGKGNTADSTANGGRAEGNSQIAIGRDNKATKEDTLALGRENTASGNVSLAIGARTEATNSGSIAIAGNGDGYKTTSTGFGSIAIGMQSNSTGTASAAVGAVAQATAKGASALGYRANATAESATALGQESVASVKDGVALGSNSKATTDKGVVGYNPADSRTNTYAGLSGNAKTSTLAAVSVGDGSNATRQITGVAAGKEDTDAVNVAQLKNVNLKYAGNSGSGDVLLNNGTLNLKGEGLISTTADASGVTVKLTTGDAITNNNGKAVAPSPNGVATTDNVVQAINKAGWNANASANGGALTGSATATKVVPGDTVTFSAGKNLTVEQTLGTNTQQYTYGLSSTLKDIESIQNGASKITLNNGGGTTISGGNLSVDGNKITKVAPGTDDTDAVNYSQIKGLRTEVKAGTGITVTPTKGSDGHDIYTVSSNATGGTASTESVVKKAAASGDTNIADVSVAGGKNVNDPGAQYEVSVSKNAVKDAAREAVTVNNGGNTDNPITVTPTDDANSHNTTYAVTFDGNKAAKQIPLTYKANGTGDKTVTLDKGLNFTNGTNTKAEIDNDGVVKFNLNDNVTLTNAGSLTVGGTTVNNGGLTITAPAGGTTSNVTLTQSGLDNGGNKIVNVKDGDVSATSKDAVNGSQLHAVKAAERHITPTTTGNEYTVDADGNVTMTYTDGNGAVVTGENAIIKGIAKQDLSNITNAGKKVITGLSNKVVAGDNVTVTDTEDATTGQKTYTVSANLTKVTDGTNTTVTGTGTAADPYKVNVSGDLKGITSIANTIGGPTMTIGGNSINITGGNLDLGNNKITKVAPGTDDTDAVNVKQLKDTELHITPGTYTPDANKKVKLTYTDGNNAVVTGKEAVIDLSSLATGGTTSTESVVKKADAAGDTNIADVSVAGGKNVNDPGAQYEVSVSKNAVKDAAREAVTVNNGGNTDNPITVTPTDDTANHNTTYAVTFDGDKAAKQIPLTYKANGTGDKTVTLDKGLDFTNGTNTTAEIGNDGVVKFNLNDNVTLTNAGSLTVGDTKVNNDGLTITAPAGGTTSNVTLTQSGLDNGGNKIVNVKDGDVSATSKDAVNGSQLHAVKAAERHITPTTTGNEYTVDADGNVTMTYTDGNGAVVTGENAVIKGIAKQDLSNIDNAGKNVITGLGTVVKAGDNVTVSEASDATTGQKTYTVNAVTPAVYTKADGTKVVKRPNGTYTTNLDGSAGNDVPASDVIVSFQDAAGNTTGGSSIVNNVGSAIDKTGTSTGNTFLTKLDTAANDTPNAAVNVKDLKNTSDAIIGKGLRFDANDGGEKTNKLGSKVTVQGEGTKANTEYSGTNIKTIIAQTGDDTTIDVKLAKDLTGINSIANTVGGPTMTFGGNSINITGGNLDLGGSKITNLGPATAGSDAVNYDQLKNSRTEITSSDNSVTVTPTISGDKTTYDLKVATTGTVAKSSWNIASDKVSATEGTVDADSQAAQNIADTKTVTMQAGKNLTVKQTNDNGNASVAFALDKDLKDLTSVTTKEINLPDPHGATTATIKYDDNRITYTNDGGTTEYKVANLNDEKHITKGEYTVGDKSIDPNAANDEVTLTYTSGYDEIIRDNAGNPITTKIKGIAKSDLSNITNEGKKEITKLGTIVKAGDNVTVSEASDATTGQKTYTVNAVTPAVYTKADGTKVVKRPNGTYTTNLDGSAGNDVPASDVIVSFQDAAGNTTGGSSIVNNVGSAIDKTGTSTGDTFLTNLNDAATATPFAAVNVRDLKSTADALKASELHIAPTAVKTGSTEAKGGVANGAENVYKYDAATKKVTLTYNDGNGKAVTDTKAVIDFTDLNVPAGGNNYGFKANATANGGTVEGTATETAVENGGTVNFAAGKNLTVKQDLDATNKTHTYTFSLDKDLTNLDKVVVNGKDGIAGKDGVTIVGPQGATGATGIPGTNGIDGKVGITGKDGKDAVSIAGKDGVGTIGLTGPQGPAGTNGKSVDISTENGTKTLVKPEANNNDQSQRIVYVPKDANGNPLKDADNNDIKREVATMDDGLRFTGNNTSTENKQKLGSLVKVEGEGVTEAEANSFQSATGNIAVVADGADKLTVKLNKDLKGLDSVTTKEVKLGDANDNISIKKDGDRITYTTPGSTDTHKVATLDDEMHIKDTTYTVDGNKKVTMTYVDGNGNPVAGKTAVIDLSGLPVGEKDTDMRIKEGDYTAKNGSVTLNTVDKDGNPVAGKDVVIKGINTNNYQAGDNVTFTSDSNDANGNPIVKINAKVSTEQVVAKAGNDNLATVAPATGSTQGGKGATYEVNVDKTNLENKAEISYKSSTSTDAGSQTAKKTTLAKGFDFTSDNNTVAITTGDDGKVNFRVDTSGIQGKAFNLDVNKEGTGKVENAQTAAPTPSVEKGTKFVAGNNLSIRHDGINGDAKYDHQVTYALNSDLKGITSITNNGGATMNFGPNEISMTGGNLNMGDNKITNVKNGTDKSDVATVGQLTKVTSNDNSVSINKSTDADGAPVYDLSVQGGRDPRVDELGEEIGRVGAQGAALAALKPIQYDPLEPTQIMAGYGNYRGNSAIAMGVAHYKNESTLMHAGLSWAGGSRHMMANAGVTWKVGNRDSEAAVADRYRKGPISSAYAMQQEMASVKAQNAGLKTEVSDLKAENEQMKAQIAAMMAKLGM